MAIDLLQKEIFEMFKADCGDSTFYDLQEMTVDYIPLYHLPMDRRWFWLCKVYVPKHLRGQGWGKLLMEEIKQSIPLGAGIVLRAESFGDSELTDEQLVQFYANCGFKIRPVYNRNYMIWIKE